MSRFLRTLAGCVVVAGLFVIAAWMMNLAAYHWWAASGPPTPNPDRHRQWGNRFFVGSIATIAALAFATWIYVRWLHTKRLQYSLRTLLLLPLIVATLGSLWRAAAPPDICIAVLALVGTAVFLLIRAGQK